KAAIQTASPRDVVSCSTHAPLSPGSTFDATRMPPSSHAAHCSCQALIGAPLPASRSPCVAAIPLDTGGASVVPRGAEQAPASMAQAISAMQARPFPARSGWRIRDSGDRPMGKTVAEVPADKLALYEKLVATLPGVERKGATVPYTSVNGHMFSYLTKTGTLALRLPAEAREAFLAKYKT